MSPLQQDIATPLAFNRTTTNLSNNTNNNNMSDHTTTHHSATVAALDLHYMTPQLLTTKASQVCNSDSLATFLEQEKYMIFNLSDEQPSDKVLQMYSHQILSLEWKSPGPDSTETPGFATLLPWVYALQAWISSQDHIAIVYCSNGWTRTALVVATYLRSINRVRSTSDGFCHFLQVRDNIATTTPVQILKELPPSLHTLFRSWDDAMDYGTYIQRKPMLLRAVGLEGVPIEKVPIIELWNANGELLYTSNKEKDESKLTWCPPDGLFQTDIVVQGDFCIIAKLDETKNDAANWIFRYVHTTGFVGASAPYELSADMLDVMKPFATNLDLQDFLVTFVWEADWNCTIDEFKQELSKECSPEQLPPVHTDSRACDAGWKIIHEHHTLHPTHDQIEALQRIGDLTKCPEHYVSLALKLSNNDPRQAHAWLWSGPMANWWRPPPSAVKDEEAIKARQAKLASKKEKNKAASRKILDLLKSADVDMGSSSSFDKSDNRPHVPDSAVRYNYKSCMMNIRVGDIQTASGSRKSLHPMRRTGSRPQYPLMPRKNTKPLVSQTSPLEDPANEDAVDLLMRLDDSSITLQDILSIKNMVKKSKDESSQDNCADKDSTEQGTTSSSKNDTSALSAMFSKTGKKDVEDKDKIEADSHAESNIDEKESITDESKKPHSALASLFAKRGGDETKKPANALAAMFAKRGNNDNTKQEAERDETEPEKKTGHAALASLFAKRGASESVEAAETEKLDKNKLSQLFAKKSSINDAAQDNQAKSDVPMKKDEKYAKYYKMKMLKIPDGAIRNAMQRDEVDESILELDWNKSYASQVTAAPVPMKKDERFEKYWKMKSLSLPDGAIKNAMKRDGVDESIWDLNWDEPYEAQLSAENNANDKVSNDNADGPALKDDPVYAKYWKMKQLKLPDGAIRNAMQRDGVDESVLDLDWEKSLASQQQAATDDGPALKDDPTYGKYWKMKIMGLPDGAVRNAMIRDGVDESVLDLDWEKSLASQQGSKENEDTDPPLKDDPVYAKYWKMKCMGLPDGAVVNAMVRDGVDDSVISLDWEKSLASQRKKKQEKETPLKDEEEFKKYFAMLKKGLPLGAVKNALVRDGKDPSIMDLDPEKALKSQSISSKKSPVLTKKKRVRRKKIFWNALDPGQIQEGSLWNLVRGQVGGMQELKYDEKEFDELFTESADPADKKKKTTKGPSQQKKLVQVIDGKRSMNGGIILLRLRMDYKVIAGIVDVMQNGKLDATQLKALSEVLPTIDEKQGLLAYMKQAGETEEAKQKAYNDFSECEKYMYSMMDVEDAAKKMECMLFRAQFQSRLNDLVDPIKTTELACDEVRESKKLRGILGMILVLVNKINTGGEGKGAAGFNLDALLKLNEAKAFDKKTSVLQYLVKLVKHNDESLLDFHKDLSNSSNAMMIVLDSMVAELKALDEELSGVHEAAQANADKLEKEGKISAMSLQELKEQRTSIRSIKSVPQFTMIDHHTGRTPMERFTMSATNSIRSALAYADEIKTKYQNLLAFFGEDQSMSSNDFFGTMTRFITEFNVAADIVEKEDKARIKEENKRKKKVQSLSPRGKGAPKVVPDRALFADLAKKAVTKAAAINDRRDNAGDDNSIHSGVAVPSKVGLTMAAAAAAEGSDDKLTNSPTSISSGPNNTLAQDNKSGKQDDETGKSTDQTDQVDGFVDAIKTSPPTMDRMSIAAAAAAAADSIKQSNKKNQVTDSDTKKDDEMVKGLNRNDTISTPADHKLDTSESVEKDNLTTNNNNNDAADKATEVTPHSESAESKPSKSDEKDNNDNVNTDAVKRSTTEMSQNVDNVNKSTNTEMENDVTVDSTVTSPKNILKTEMHDNKDDADEKNNETVTAKSSESIPSTNKADEAVLAEAAEGSSDEHKQSIE